MSDFNDDLDEALEAQEEELRVSSRKRTKAELGAQAQSPLETYLREINETPLLSAKEERELARGIGQGDVRARDHMVRANLRLVVNIARGYIGKDWDCKI